MRVGVRSVRTVLRAHEFIHGLYASRLPEVLLRDFGRESRSTSEKLICNDCCSIGHEDDIPKYGA